VKNTLNTLSNDRRPPVKENRLGTTGLYKGTVDESLCVQRPPNISFSLGSDTTSWIFDVFALETRVVHCIIFDASHNPKVTQYKKEARGFAGTLQGLIG
jgi:hypothetical protein